MTVGARVREEPVDDARAASLLDRMGLAGYGDRPIEDLSGGEAQRVAIARTLYVDPEVLLLDEPTAHLDAATEADVETLLAELVGDDDLTCVVVTHDPDQAGRLGDRVARFEAGRVVAYGPPEVVLA